MSNKRACTRVGGCAREWTQLDIRRPLDWPSAAWVATHRTSKATDVYDGHGDAEEDRRIMAAVARPVLSLVEGAETSNVVSLR